MQKYSDSDFQSGLLVKIPFHFSDFIPMITVTPQSTSTPKLTAQKVWEDQQLCVLYFCPENGCKCSFDEQQDYEVHILEGNHQIITERGAMDTVKKAFISKMKAISTPAINSSDAHIADIDLTFACTEVPLMSIFSTPGWALPVRSNFRYSYEQKKFLYDSFKEGEISGKNMSPELVHLKMRKDFSTSQYVTVQQIKSLFSRMTAEQRKGTLKETTKISQPEEYVVSEGEEAIIDNNQITETACTIMTEIMDFECNNWVIVLYMVIFFLALYRWC